MAQSLYRPSIDEEVRLIWLPEMEQGALNIVVRQIHVDLRNLGESTYCEDIPKRQEEAQARLYNSNRIFLDRSRIILERLGSARASDLVDAYTILAKRHFADEKPPLGGLRIFPTGRFYVDGANVYGQIVDSWRGVSAQAALGRSTTPMTEHAL